MIGDDKGIVSDTKAKKYKSAGVTDMYIMQWSHPDIFHVVQGLARHMTVPI